MTVDKFKLHSSIWEENAKTNAKWAVISDPAKLASGFQAEEFLNSGMNDIEHVLSKLQAIDAKVDFEGKALDFGCGVGRLSAALARKFHKVIGVDVSPEMVRQARELTSARDNIEFVANQTSDLRIVDSSSISFLLSLIVIQHIPPPYSLNYLKEFSRVLKPGGILVVQIPTKRMRSLKNLVRSIVPEKLFRMKHSLLKTKVPYVTMFGISEEQVTEIFKEYGLTKLLIEPDTSAGADWESRTYFFKA